MYGLDFRIGPSDGRDLGPADPLQGICRKWVQKLGSNGATACLGMGDDQIEVKNTESDDPTFQGERTPRPRM